MMGRLLPYKAVVLTLNSSLIELYSADDINYCLPEVLLITKMEPIEQFQKRSLGSLTCTEDVVIICHIIIVPSVHMMTLRTVLQLADEHKD